MFICRFVIVYIRLYMFMTIKRMHDSYSRMYDINEILILDYN